MATLYNIYWQTLKDMCDTYDNGSIFKQQKYKNVEFGSDSMSKCLHKCIG